jgi:hypothetical protein
MALTARRACNIGRVNSFMSVIAAISGHNFPSAKPIAKTAAHQATAPSNIPKQSQHVPPSGQYLPAFEYRLALFDKCLGGFAMVFCEAGMNMVRRFEIETIFGGGPGRGAIEIFLHVAIGDAWPLR